MRQLKVQLLRSESGMTLLVTLGVISGLMIAGGALLTATSSNSHHATYSADNVVAQNVAESGMNYARSILWAAADPTDPAAIGSGTITLESGTATYSGTLSGNVWTLTGTGSTPNSAGGLPITETVSSQVEVSNNGAPSEPQLAIFAADSDCSSDAFQTNGDDTTIAGSIRSNGDFEVDGNNFSASAASGHGAPCDVKITGAKVQLQTSRPDGKMDRLEIDDTVWDWPLKYSESDFICTFKKDKFEFNTDGALIPAGVYCATEKFTVNGNNMSGTFTVLSPVIDVNGEGQIFSPFANDLLFFATGTEDIKLSGFGYSWAGTIYHPNGQVNINGDYASHLAGMIVAREVTLNGAGFTMSGVAPTSGPGSASSTVTLENVAGSYAGG